MGLIDGGSGSPGLLIPAITVGSLIAAALWEALRRRRQHKFPTAKRRAGNVGFWLFNTTIAAVVFAPPDQLWAPWPLPPWLGFVVGFLALDFLIYAVHRAYHAVPLLWRLHALHHSDPDLDVTTAVRHHPVEYLSAGAIYWIAILAIGVPGPVVAVHGVIVFTMAALTHAAVRWPAWAERALQPLLITLDTHLVHHSIDLADANFGPFCRGGIGSLGPIANPRTHKSLAYTGSIRATPAHR